MEIPSASLLLAAALAAGPAAVSACATGPGATAAAAATRTATISVSGMTCSSCAVTVKAAVNRLPGISTVEVDVEGGKATVRFDDSQVSAQQIADKITSAGYQASVTSTTGT